VTLIIGLHGRAVNTRGKRVGGKLVGKSVVADFLIEHHGFVRNKMAGPLKNTSRAMLREAGYDDAMIERIIEGDLKDHWIIPELGCTGRVLQVRMGTEFGRDMIHPDLWVNLWRSRTKVISLGSSIVADDIRFENEARTIRALGGVVVVVQRTVGDDYPRVDHPSETTDIVGDHLIVNYSTIAKLRKQAELLVQTLVSRARPPLELVGAV